ncbi:MAG TPA: hypothetical protein VGL39_18965 [Jatrophihabitantaceae bacterium]|jgi:hypothetical protein
MPSTRTRRTATLLLIAVLALLAAVGVAFAAQPAKPGITLQISPAGQSVTRGQSASYTVSATSTGGFTGSVSLSAGGLPSGASAAFAPTSVTLSSGSTTTSALTVTTTSTMPVGSYTLTVTGTSGKVSGSVNAGLTVNYPLSSSLTMTVTPASITMAPGAAAVYTVALARTNLPGAVAFSVAGGLPTGATATYSPNPTTGTSSTLQITTNSTTPGGTYDLYLVASGQDPGGTTRYAYANVQLVIATTGKPFTISGNLPGVLAPGMSVPLNLTLTNPNNKPLSITNLTVTVQSVTRAASATKPCGTADYSVTQYSGPYPLTVPANGSGSLTSLGVAQSSLPKVSMINAPTNQDGCKGATLTLAYSGSGQGS